MSQDDILNRFNSLPPEGKQQVLDLIDLLQARYGGSQLLEKAENMEKEPFLGMWKEREEMQDSTAWVRDRREREWVKQGG